MSPAPMAPVASVTTAPSAQHSDRNSGEPIPSRPAGGGGPAVRGSTDRRALPAGVDHTLLSCGVQRAYPALRRLPGALGVLADHDDGRLRGVRGSRARGAVGRRLTLRPRRPPAGVDRGDRRPDRGDGRLQHGAWRARTVHGPCGAGLVDRIGVGCRRRGHARHRSGTRHHDQRGGADPGDRNGRAAVGDLRTVPAGAHAPHLPGADRDLRPAGGGHPADGRDGATAARSLAVAAHPRWGCHLQCDPRS